jgi:hypothetical protein
LKLGRKATTSMVHLLEDTIWGTPGAMRYQHLDTAEKIAALPRPWFLYLEKEEETIGVLCLDQRQIDGMDAFYIRYFSFAEGMRRKGTDEAEHEIPASRGQGAFKRFSSSFFEKPNALLESASTTKAIFYAYVELENARSRDMVKQMGLNQCGQFNTLVFSRLFPKKNENVRRARPDEQPQLRRLVAQHYQNHAFFTDHGLFYKDNYFVLEVNGQVVAGLQAHVVHWKVMEIPKLSGKIMMTLMPWIPLLRRLFNPNAFNFAAIEGLFWLPGHEHQIQNLLEGSLATLGLHTALLWLSPESPVHETVKANVSMGLLQRFKNNLPATVVMRPYGYSEEELELLMKHPPYISAFDST